MIALLTLTALAMAVTGLWMWRHSARLARSESAIDRAIQRHRHAQGTAPVASRRSLRQRITGMFEAIGNQFSKGSLGRHLVASEDIMLLNVIGHDNSSGRAIFLAIRLLLPLVAALPCLLLFQLQGPRRMALLLALLCMGLLVPKWMLGAWAGRRRRKAGQELPLLVDLLRLLQGSGFSMDQSLQMVADRFGSVMPVLGRELQEANTFYSHGRSREQSLQHLRTAYENDSIRALVQLILQVHQHGGAVQEPLRLFGERLREQRLMEMKERAGKLSVKMTIVMMVTLLPALMAVLIGPAIVSLQGTMSMLHSAH